MLFKAPKGIYIHTREPPLASKFGYLDYSQELGRNDTYLRGQHSFLQVHALNFKQIDPGGFGVLNVATLLINLVF